MKIGVDIDGTVADTHQRMIKIANKIYGKNVDINTPIYKIEENYGISKSEVKKMFETYILAFFSSAKPYDSASKILKHWKHFYNHEIIFITARHNHVADRIITEEWLERHNFIYDNLIMGAKDKANVCLSEGIDVLIEDLPENAKAVASIGIPVLLVKQPYNEGFICDNVHHVDGWLRMLPKITQVTGHSLLMGE